jgi:ubiquitin-conjugating enzyme E2 O
MLFEKWDTVVLRDDSRLVGTVERTNSSTDGSPETSIEDLLIVNYADVAESALIEFVSSGGTPPPHYVFVHCWEEEKGCFLAHENQLTLLSRTFDLGETIKRNGQTSSMIGEVISLKENYTLEPIFRETKDGQHISVSDPRTQTDSLSFCDEHCPPHAQEKHNQIANVPAEDITLEQDLFDAEPILYKDWVGFIEDSDFDIVVRLTDGSVVVFQTSEELHVPIRDPEKPLVSLPEIDNLTRPSIVGAFQGWNTIPVSKVPRVGIFVVTSKDALKEARWLVGRFVGSHGPGAPTPTEGNVIGAVPRTVSARWVTSSPFSRSTIDEIHMPSRRQTVYRNINTWKSPSELKVKAGLQMPLGDIDVKHRVSATGASTYEQHQCVNTWTHDIRAGDQVRFRDPTAAAVKYGSTSGTHHGYFRRIQNLHYCPGWDLNVFKVVEKDQTVVVRWQDGSETTQRGNDLWRFAAFESALTPGQVVLGRANLKQKPAELESLLSGAADSTTPLSEFNEMALFEKPHDLVPSKVGIIQSVDPEERVAKVRWFKAPKIMLLENGEVLHPESWFGKIGDTIEEVSLYEVMSFPAFDRQLLDLAIMPAYTNIARLNKRLKNKDLDLAYDMPEASNPALDFDRLLIRARTCLKHAIEIESMLPSGDTKGDDAWVGTIYGLELDGTLTVRVRTSQGIRTARITLDFVLASINVDEVSVPEFELEEDLEEWFEDYMDRPSRSPSPTIEYEGGQRLDDDNDDDAWISEDEDSDNNTENQSFVTASPTRDRDSDVEMTDASTQTANPPTISRSSPQKADQRHSTTIDDVLRRLREHWPSEEPPAFDVLTCEPPDDEFGVRKPASSHPHFLKRISKEHKILSSSLPKGQIYVRTYESRLDLLRCLIVGPPDTPYEDAPFLIDLHLGSKFPEEPPTAHFHSWTSGLGRINPNLYEEGKICLSLLGTWPGKGSGESWSRDASILQLLVSLQGLVLVRNPFFNEAGFEGLEEDSRYKTEAAQYAEKAFVMARGFVRHVLVTPPSSMEPVIAWLYLPDDKKRQSLTSRIVQRGRDLINRSEETRVASAAEHERDELMDAEGKTGDPTKAFLRPLSKGAMVMLQRTLQLSVGDTQMSS